MIAHYYHWPYLSDWYNKLFFADDHGANLPAVCVDSHHQWSHGARVYVPPRQAAGADPRCHQSQHERLLQ